MSQAESYLQSESAVIANPEESQQSRFGSLLNSLNIFRRPK
jgi:hypothetical protein